MGTPAQEADRRPNEYSITVLVMNTRALNDVFRDGDANACNKGAMRRQLHYAAALELEVFEGGKLYIDKARFASTRDGYKAVDVPHLVNKHMMEMLSGDPPPKPTFQLIRTHRLGPPCDSIEEATNRIRRQMAGDKKPARYYCEAHGHVEKHGFKYQVFRAAVRAEGDSYEELFALAFECQKTDDTSCKYEIVLNV
jgi:hypothetical protein